MMYVIVLAGLIVGAYVTGRGAGPSGLLVPVLGAGAMTLVPACAAAVLMIYCGVKSRGSGAAADPDERWSASWAYSRGTLAINGLYILAYWIALDTFGWAGIPDRFHIENWWLASRLIVAAPFLASIVLAWIPLHYAELHVRRWGPTLRQQLSFNIRQYILTICVPLGILLAVFDLMQFLSARVGGVLDNGVVQTALGGALVLGVYAFAPIALVRVWRSSRLPECPLRERLTALCQKIGVVFRDIRIWETPGLHFLNAAVLGAVGRVRYIVVSRTLVETMPPDQVEAVFAHELGHAKRHHMAYYFVFALDFLLLGWVFEILARAPEAWPEDVYTVTCVAAFAVYWGIGFGYLSRAFERESDLFGAETIGDNALFASALQMIAHMNGVSPSTRSWRHGSIKSRVAFLEAAAGAGTARQDFLAKVEFLKTFVLSLGAVALAAILILQALA